MEYKNGSALSGIRVLDLGNVLSAPLGAAILADLGAEVIKVERPKGGDSARFNNPIKDGVSTYFINFNRSKKGITLDISEAEEFFLHQVTEQPTSESLQVLPISSGKKYWNCLIRLML